MSDERVVTIAVTPEERRIISALRDLPPSPLKDLLAQVIARLVEFAANPGCPEMQADGAPCASPTADCEQCRQLKAVLESLRNRFSAT
jgi:DNA-binding MarR family transcriptional regulator